MEPKRGDAPYLIVHHRDDHPWAQWVAEQLRNLNVECDYFYLDERDLPLKDARRSIVLDSTVARAVQNEPYSGRKFFWAGAQRGKGVVLRIAAAAAASTFRGRVALYRWDADLVGRTEAAARRELLRVMADRFGLDVQKALRSRRRSSIRFPGLATVFISYRRADDIDGIVRRLHSCLSAQLEHARIFLDVADPDPESDITRRLSSAIGNAPAMLAVIGPNWRGERSGAAARIFDDNDFVRFELAEALADYHDVSVLVVLLPGGHICTARELPERLGGLTSAPALVLDVNKFDESVERLVGLLLETKLSRHNASGDPAHPIAAEEDRPFSRSTRRPGDRHRNVQP